jgi:hypothetical protein
MGTLDYWQKTPGKPSFEKQRQPTGVSADFLPGKMGWTDPARRDRYEITERNKKPLPVFPEGA